MLCEVEAALFLSLEERLVTLHRRVLCWVWALHEWSLICCRSSLRFLMWEFLSGKGVESCQMLFSASLEIIVWFLSFLLLLWYVTLVDFHMLNSLCILEINLTWSWCIILLMCYRIQFASVSWGFCCLFIRDVGPQCSFLAAPLTLVSWWRRPRSMSLEMFPPLQIFGNISGGLVLILF